jgi:hypothetical protein
MNHETGVPCSYYLESAFLYFAVVFAAGFILGPIRILAVLPRIGVRWAELAELPLMILVTLFAARWVILRCHVHSALSARLAIGIPAVLILLAAEFGVAIGLRGMSLLEAITSRDPVSGTAYYISLGLFAIMPALVSRHS